MRDGGCYGHVDGPRFNTRAEIRGLATCGVTAVSQTAGPETTLAGEAEIPLRADRLRHRLRQRGIRRAHGDRGAPRLIQASGDTLATTLQAAVGKVDEDTLEPVGTHFRWD